MSRIQLALNVSNLEDALRFYSKMFVDVEIVRRKPGYASLAVVDPPLKLVLFENPNAISHLNHLGVEVDSAKEVLAAEARLTGEDLDTTGVDNTECCFASKTETWVYGPDTEWEWYVRTGDSEQLENELVGDCCT